MLWVTLEKMGLKPRKFSTYLSISDLMVGPLDIQGNPLARLDILEALKGRMDEMP